MKVVLLGLTLAAAYSLTTAAKSDSPEVSIPFVHLPFDARTPTSSLRFTHSSTHNYILSAHTPLIQLTPDNFDKQIIKSDGPALVLFYGKCVGTCVCECLRLGLCNTGNNTEYGAYVSVGFVLPAPI